MIDGLPENMAEKIIPVTESGCWLWIGGLDGGGYAQAYYKPTKTKVKAHKFIYEFINGKVPKGLELDHLCRVRSCVNPAHLEAVTHSINVRRGDLMKIRSAQQKAKTHCPRGHEYKGDNLYTRKSGARKACHRLLQNERRSKRIKENIYGL